MRSSTVLLSVLFAIGCQAASADTATQPADVRMGPVPQTNTGFVPATYATLRDWQRRREFLREQVRFAAGLIPAPPQPPIDAHIFGKLVRDGYTIEKVYFESFPGFYVTGNLYRPLNSVGRCPAVACPHGHWKDGRLQQGDRGDVPARCITLARNGAVVFAYDMVGYNDSARSFKHRDERLETPANALWGIGHFALQTFNSIRVLDFLQSLPDVDGDRIGVTGASGGGTQTFILAAVDDRVTVDCPVNMISSTMQGGCVCENAPLLRIGTNNMEIAAVFAPKPQLMISASGDWTKLTPKVEFPFVRSIYELYNAADHVANVHIDAPHNYNRQSREAMYQFFGKHLLHGNHIHEGKIPVETPEDMLVFNEAYVPANLLSLEQIIEAKKAESIKLLEPYEASKGVSSKSVDLIRTWAQHAIDPEPYAGVSQCAGNITDKGSPIQYEAMLNRNGRLVPIVGLINKQQPGTNAVIIIDPDGRQSLEKHKDLVQRLLATQHRVIFAEPFSTGRNCRTTGLSAEEKKFFTTFNRTDAAEAVYDLLTVLAAADYDCRTALKTPQTGLEPIGLGDNINLHLKGIHEYSVVAFGRMGPIALLAQAVHHAGIGPQVLVADMNGFGTSSDAAYVNALFIPGIRRVGGLPAIGAAAAVAAGYSGNGAARFTLHLHNTAGKFDTSWLDRIPTAAKADVHISSDIATADQIVSVLP